MKRDWVLILLVVIAILVAVFVVQQAAGQSPEATTPSWKSIPAPRPKTEDYLVIYTKKITPNYYVLTIVGADPIPPITVKTTKWFWTAEDAVNWLNGKGYDPCHLTDENRKNGIGCFIQEEEKAPEARDVEGLFHVEKMELETVTIGQYDSTETRQVPVKRDKLEWKVKP